MLRGPGGLVFQFVREVKPHSLKLEKSRFETNDDVTVIIYI